jgi:hypothetical protein
MTALSRPISAVLRGAAQQPLAAQDLATYVYDLNLLYELLVLEQLDPEAVRPGNATTWILARTGRSIPRGTRLLVPKLAYGSPFEILLQLQQQITGVDLVVAAGAFWAFVQSIEKLYNLPSNRRLIDAQARKANAEADQLETKGAALLPHEQHDALGEPSRPRSQIDPIAVAERRLTRGRIRITEVEYDLLPYEQTDEGHADNDH